ncbi:MAG: pantoate--beta-alanine ligase [Candidatus Cloacimonetes bacterium]|nr:pantoate--beta-alanine ligase [Candidatus Cloacimonadota bacterium]
MQLINTITEMQALAQNTFPGKSIGFVPTMGFLHQGHLSLVERSVSECDLTVVSIFVNPAQFGANEDLDSYPRDMDRDLKLLEPLGVDYVFFPSNGMMYPSGYKTWVEVRELSDVLCGASRPGHFVGVATVVLKLVNLVKPTYMYMGEKDFQQVTVLQTMLRDLNLSTRIVPCPIIRDGNGLALSSRNTYLSPTDYPKALSLSRCITRAQELASSGERLSENILRELNILLQNSGAKPDYISIVDSRSLSPQSVVDCNSRLILAAFVGKTRLIDNGRVLLDN